MTFNAFKDIYILINELTRNEIASLILGVLDAEMCRAKYKYKKQSLTSYSSFTPSAIIRLRVVYEKLSVINVSNSRRVGGTLLLIGCHEELVFMAALRY